MCGVIPMMAAGKVSPGTVASSLGGVAGLALHHALKKKTPPPTAAQTFYGAANGGA